MRDWSRRSPLSSLRTRLMLLVLLAVIPALGLILHTAASQRRSAAIKAQEDLLRLVKVVAANQRQASEGARQLLIALAQMPEIQKGNIAACNQLLTNLLRQYRAYAGFGVADAEGNALCSAPITPHAVYAGDRAYFRLARDTRNFAIGEYQTGRITETATLNFGYPILDESGQVKAIVTAALDLNWLDQLATEVELPEGSVVTVTDRKGTVLVQYPDSINWVGKRLPDTAMTQELLSQSEGTAEAIGADGVERLFAFTTLGSGTIEQSVHVRIGVPKTVAFAQANHLLEQNLTGLGIVTVLALTAAWVGGDIFLTRKVKSLVQTTQKLQQGDLSTRTELAHEAGELGQLARAFDEMAAAIEAREQAIAALNQDLQTLFEVVPIGVLIAQDPNFKQVRSNPAFAQILGLLPDANVSYTPENTPPPDYKLMQDGRELSPNEFPLRYAAIHKTEIKGTEVDIVRGDGKVFNLFGYAKPLLNEQGQVRGSVAAFLDITERKCSEAELARSLAAEQTARAEAEAANRIKDEFLAVLSHELRTPLNPILGWSKMLRSRKYDTVTTERALESIERNAKLQTQLIEDLLDVSRILQGKLRLDSSPVDLITTIQAAIETVQLAANTKSITIQTQLDPAVGRVSGDAGRLQQVVWNLLSNAVKFTPTGGRVEVSLSLITDSTRNIRDAQICVTDSGKGMSADLLPYVFNTFWQADSATTRQFGGLGLGLAIARHIVELHGGTITATSAGEGQGSTFLVRLPSFSHRRAAPDPSRNGSLLRSQMQPLQGLNILVVDDEADTRDFFAFVLQQAGAEVQAAASATDALQRLTQATPDLLLSDVGMPEVDGYMLMQQVRRLAAHQGGNIPAIAVTAYAAEVDQQQAIAAGFQQHLSKPIEPEELVRAIASLTVNATSPKATG